MNPRSPFQKRVLVIDAVDWSEETPPGHPLRNVGQWFTRHFNGDDAVVFHVVHAQSDELHAALPDAQAVILSGSPRDAWVDDPVNERLGQVINTCREKGIPFLGVCYGHQLLGCVLGGKVDRNPVGWELGGVSVALTDAGQESPLFAGLPHEFTVLASHQDAVLTLPPDTTLLATSERTQVQAMQCRHLFGVEFHPETAPEILRFIWAPRRTAWRGRTGFDLDARLDGLPPTPHTATILRNFVHHFAA